MKSHTKANYHYRTIFDIPFRENLHSIVSFPAFFFLKDGGGGGDLHYQLALFGRLAE